MSWFPDIGVKPYYEDGAVIIFHGDCRDVLPLIPKESVDLVLTDPPYGLKENAHKVAKRGKLAANTDYGEFDWDKQPADAEQIELTIGRGHEAIIWGGNYFHVPPSRGWLVWDKLNSGNFADCELAWTNINTSVRIFRFMWNGMIRDGEAKGVPRVHPAQKPVELMRWCLGFGANPQVILDPFLGSGTTARAAKDLGRKCIGIEIEEQYCEIAAKRMAQTVMKL